MSAALTQRLPSLRRTLDRLSVYLPVILTALLALGTYWLVRNAPKLLAPAAQQAPTHEPDYTMRDFVVKNFLPDGTLRSELRGREGRHFPDTDTIEVDGVRAHSVTDDGLKMQVSADRGISNADATEVQLFGHAVVVREAGVDAQGTAVPRLEFRGEFLHAWLDEQRVSSNKPVILVRGNNRFTADSLDYRQDTGVAVLRGQVHGQLAGAGVAAGKP